MKCCTMAESGSRGSRAPRACTRNKENTLTFPVAPHTVHLGGIGSGLHGAGSAGSPRLSSRALDGPSGVGAPAAAAGLAAASRLRTD